eukprot:gene14655-14779_t
MTVETSSAGASAPTPRHDHVPLGIAFMVAATFLFALSSAIAKWSVALYPVGEVMFFRSASSLIACSVVILPITGFAVFRTARPRDHLARGLSQAISQTFSVLALGLMPLAGAVAISFSAPLWATLISALWLKEHSSLPRWIALLIGLCGVLIVTKPGADTLQLGAVFALANAIMYGSVTVAVRGMTKTEPAYTLLMWQMASLAVFHACLLVFGFHMPTLIDFVILCSSGITNALAQYCWTRALHLAPTTAVSPFYYLILVWALLIGFIGWGQIPSTALVLGSCIVVASGLFLLWNEVQRPKVQAQS